jgi:hypothetical protein
MGHKGFNIEPSQTQSGQWRATITHPGGTVIASGKQVDRFETGDYPNSESAIGAAKMEIDFLRVKQYFER